MLLELPPLRSGVFFYNFFMTLRRAEQLCFCCIFRPFSQVGDSRPHSTRFYYLSFYGRALRTRHGHSPETSDQRLFHLMVRPGQLDPLSKGVSGS